MVRKRGPSNAKVRAGDGVVLEYLLEVDELENGEEEEDDDDEEEEERSTEGEDGDEDEESAEEDA